MLRFFVLLADHNTGRHMRDSDCRVSCIDRLPPRAGRSEHIDPQVAFINFDIHILGFGQHRNGRRRCMNPPASFGFRNALYTMHTRFKFQPRKHIGAGNGGGGFFISANAGLRHLHHLKPPAIFRCETLIHAE